jgi:hypothetical protein
VADGLVMHRQRIVGTPLADLRGGGIPHDCLRAAVASLTGAGYDEVPHFALYPEWWWDVLRTWARGRGRDFACLAPVDGQIRQFILDAPDPPLLIAAGPSPRGPSSRHVVLVDLDLALVHDPHPSGAGLVEVDEVYVLVDPYDEHPVAPLALVG